MRYLVKVEELKNKNEYLEKQLKLIDESILVIESLKSKLIWEGDTKESFIVKYDEYLEKLKKFEQNYISFLAFMKSFQGNYAEEYQNLKREYANVFSEMVM